MEDILLKILEIDAVSKFVLSFFLSFKSSCPAMVTLSLFFSGIFSVCYVFQILEKADEVLQNNFKFLFLIFKR